MMHDTQWLFSPCKSLNTESKAAATEHQTNLTKPPGSLGKLEDIAIKFAAWQGKTKPSINQPLVRVFAADHGVCQQGVSAFPQEVTAQMVLNFLHGGAAISVLSKSMDADFAVVNMGTVTPLADAPQLVNVQLCAGTNDFSQESAMSSQIMHQALNIGRDQLRLNDADLFMGGDMGIGNTTSASAIYSALLKLDPASTVGPGTGVDQDGLEKKRLVIQTALDLHKSKLEDPLDVLQHLGGLEIAGLVGAYIAAAQKGVPSLIDGFISTAAALIAVKINPEVSNWLLFAHKSAEPAHIQALNYLAASPLLDLEMRLGEGSGAAVATGLLFSALELHNKMATFADAGVSDAA